MPTVGKRTTTRPAGSPNYGARALALADFEDPVVSAAAEAANCDYIVTRNLDDFKGSPVAAISPEDFCRLFSPRSVTAVSS